MDENIKEVHFPDSFVCEDKDGYSTIPYMQGLLIPNRYEYDYSHIAFDGQFTSCAAYMPWLSQTNNGKGYIATMKRLGILNIQLIMMIREQDFNLYG